MDENRPDIGAALPDVGAARLIAIGRRILVVAGAAVGGFALVLAAVYLEILVYHVWHRWLATGAAIAGTAGVNVAVLLGGWSAATRGESRLGIP